MISIPIWVFILLIILASFTALVILVFVIAVAAYIVTTCIEAARCAKIYDDF